MNKYESTPTAKIKPWLVAILFLFPWLLACADDVTLPKPPIYVPFEAQKAGSAYTTELRVMEHRIYQMSLFVRPKKGESWEDLKRFDKLLGGPLSYYKNGKPVSYGLSIPLKLKVSIIDSSGERVIYDKEILKELLTGGGGAGLEKAIDTIVLRPGRYRISIQSLKDIPELTGHPVNFSIYAFPNANPLD